MPAWWGLQRPPTWQGALWTLHVTQGWGLKPEPVSLMAAGVVMTTCVEVARNLVDEKLYKNHICNTHVRQAQELGLT